MTPTPAAARVADDIRRHGPVPLTRVGERALYDPEAGCYEVGGRSGRREGHFVTSPEVGALFGAVVARMLDEQWRALGEPPVFVVVEPGAGPGTLCRTVLAATPACSPALRYVLVERSAAQRRLHAERLRLEDPALAFPPVDPDTEVPVAEAPEGPICVSLAAMPRLPGPAVVLANELLDNLPFGLAERRGGSWCEVRVDLEPGGAGTDGGTRLVGHAEDSVRGQRFEVAAQHADVGPCHRPGNRSGQTAVQGRVQRTTCQWRERRQGSA